MYLQKLISEIKDVVEMSELGNVEILGLEYDSRRVRQGHLFIAIQGLDLDGHNFISDAISNGAVAVLGEEKMDLKRVPYIRVKDSRKALAHVSAAFFEHPADDLKIIGVTGTNGKTTTTYLLRAIFEKARINAGVIGTMGILTRGEVMSTCHTTPEALELNRVFRDMVDSGVSLVVMEVSSHSLKLDRVDGVPFEIGIFTNLTQDHLDFHSSFEDYFEAKALLFENSRRAVINTDDKAGIQLLKRLTIPTFTYGIEKAATVKAQNVQVSSDGVCYNVLVQGKRYPVSYSVPGRFSVYNSLSAIATGLSMGIPLETIIGAIKEVKGVPGRFETVDKGQDFNVIVDYSHTPDSLKNAILAAKGFCKKKVITVFGCGGDRDRKKRPLMGEIATSLSNYSIITSDNPRNEAPDAIMDEIERGCVNKKYERIVDRREAIGKAISLAKSGDVVIIAGKGHESYQILKNRTIHFDDKEVAENFLVSEGLSNETDDNSSSCKSC